MPAVFVATLVEGDAVLRFPYDDRLRLVLRAIPGRRWDPADRVWRVPLDPDRAHALTALFEMVPYPLEVSEALGRALARRRARRSPRELLVDLARPDDDWWFSFATDTAYDLVETLLEHPDAYRLPAIERGLLPVDQHAAQILRSSLERDPRLRLTDDARHALTEAACGVVPRERAPVDSLAYDVELRRDSRGGNWILIGSEHAPLARALADEGRLPLFDGPAGSVALAAVQTNAVGIADLLGRLALGSVDPRVGHWLERATTWRGTIEVDGPREAPVFLLLGGNERLPAALRELASTCRGGVRLPLTIESWRVIDAQPLEGWISCAAKRCVAALETGQPAPPAVLELSVVHEQSTFVLAPGHDLEMLDHFAQLPGVAAGRAGRCDHEHDGLPAIAADPFWVPELDRFIADHEPWVAPDALERSQQLREEHALAAGVVALSAAREATLNVPGLGGELKPFQRAGVKG